VTDGVGKEIPVGPDAFRDEIARILEIGRQKDVVRRVLDELRV
jgi:hypothetical protein